MGIVNFLLMKYRQGLSNFIKKPHCFASVSFLCLLVDLKICVCLNRTKPWFKLSIKFNQYSIRSFQKALLGINDLWTHLVFKELSIYVWNVYPTLQNGELTRFLGFLFFCKIKPVQMTTSWDNHSSKTTNADFA